jgi:hypothetical protein
VSASSSGPGDPLKRRWRFKEGPEGDPPPPFVPRSGPEAPDVDRGWLDLLLQHAPFLPVDPREQARLSHRYSELEKLILGDPDLQEYYAQTFLTRDFEKEWTGSNMPSAGDVHSPLWKLHHVASLQAQLMEDVFYSLRLDRHANAPDNRGWMNLFRRWGSSSSFNARFAAMRETFGKEFVDFYDYYVRDLNPIDQDPVPHPWERRPDERVLPGVYLDSGIREAEPRKRQAPRASPDEHAAGPDKADSSLPLTPPGGSASEPGAQQKE